METGDISKKFKLLLILVALIAVGAMAAIGFLWMKLQSVEGQAQALQSVDDETAKVVKDVGAFLMLPQGEVPELLTVSDLSQVQGQPFFANAQLGDKVLVYKQASKAVLWRPSIKKIIEVYPINLSAQ